MLILSSFSAFLPILMLKLQEANDEYFWQKFSPLHQFNYPIFTYTTTSTMVEYDCSTYSQFQESTTVQQFLPLPPLNLNRVQYARILSSEDVWLWFNYCWHFLFFSFFLELTLSLLPDDNSSILLITTVFAHLFHVTTFTALRKFLLRIGWSNRKVCCFAQMLSPFRTYPSP